MQILQQILLFSAVLSTSISITNAQEKELCINYTYNSKHWIDTLFQRNFPKKIQVIAYNGAVITREAYSYGKYLNTKGKNLPKNNFIALIDYNKGYLVEPVLNKKAIIKETLPLFKWLLCGETKKILKYTCNKATCSFRGRDYVAYFTKEIPFKAAPWKFHGIPGVVLEVYSEDNFFKWEATSLEVRSHTENIEYQFKGVKLIELEEYIEHLIDQNLNTREQRKKIILNGEPAFLSGLVPIEIFTPELDPNNFIKENPSPAYQEIQNR